MPSPQRNMSKMRIKALSVIASSGKSENLRKNANYILQNRINKALRIAITHMSQGMRNYILMMHQGLNNRQRNLLKNHITQLNINNLQRIINRPQIIRWIYRM